MSCVTLHYSKTPIGRGILLVGKMRNYGIRKVKCRIENRGNVCRMVGKMWNTKRIWPMTCGMTAITWFEVLTNQRHSAFPFRSLISGFRILPTTHTDGLLYYIYYCAC